MDKNMKICMISSLPPPIGGISRWTEMILEKSSSDSDVEIDVLDISSKGRPIGSNISNERGLFSSTEGRGFNW